MQEYYIVDRILRLIFQIKLHAWHLETPAIPSASIQRPTRVNAAQPMCLHTPPHTIHTDYINWVIYILLLLSAIDHMILTN